MKIKYTKEVGEVKTELEVDIEEFNDNIADLLFFLGFPIRIENKQIDEYREYKQSKGL